MGVKKKIVFILLILFLWQLPVSEKLVPAGHAGEKGAFTGTWVANGSKEPLAASYRHHVGRFSDQRRAVSR
jgi:hypothetical protein